MGEWKKVLGGKIPYWIQMKDGAPFVFAGLWEGRKQPGSEEWLYTCTIIMGEPNELVREIHTRMPVILPNRASCGWLSGEAGKEILVPFPADRIKAWPISPRVNSPRNNDEGFWSRSLWNYNQGTHRADESTAAGETPRF